jgi:hypothetical protein
MKIETKYNAGDMVWVFNYEHERPKAAEEMIMDVTVTSGYEINYNDDGDIVYGDCKTKIYYSTKHRGYYEAEVFTSREELLNSLID